MSNDEVNTERTSKFLVHLFVIRHSQGFPKQVNVLPAFTVIFAP
jgi:hypothetical protein